MSGSYASNNFTPTGNIAATTIQGAIAELDSEVVHNTGNENIEGIKTFTNNSTSTNTTTGALTLPGIGMGNGVIHLAEPSQYDDSQKVSTTSFVKKFSRPIVQVRVNSSLTQTAASLTVTFATETLDADNVFASTAFTAPVTGTYFVGGFLTIVNNSASSIQFNIDYHIGGSAYLRAGTVVLGASSGVGVALAPVLIPMNAAQTLSIVVTPSSSVSFTVQGSGNSHLSIFKIQ